MTALEEHARRVELIRLRHAQKKQKQATPDQPKPRVEGKNLFIHIPKTAGHSVFASAKLRTEMHNEFKNMQNRVNDETFVFSIIRNPYDRAVSLYYYLKARIHNRSCRDWNAAMCCLAQGVGVNEFWVRFITDKQFKFQCRQFPMMRPQLDFLNVKGKDIIDPRIDKIITFENLAQEWEEMQKIRGFEPLAHKNKGKNRANLHWSEELLPETIEHLSNLYDRDFKQLPYQKYAR